MTTQHDIARWFERGTKDPKNTHMIIICDTFSYEDYPVFVSEDQDVRAVETERARNMQKVMEVYNLKMDMISQCHTAKRQFNY